MINNINVVPLNNGSKIFKELVLQPARTLVALARLLLCDLPVDGHDEFGIAWPYKYGDGVDAGGLQTLDSVAGHVQNTVLAFLRNSLKSRIAKLSKKCKLYLDRLIQTLMIF